MRSADPARISDAHMVGTPTPPHALHILALFIIMVGFGSDMMVWRKRAKNCSHDLSSRLSSLFHVKVRGRICCELSRYLIKLKKIGKPW